MPDNMSESKASAFGVVKLYGEHAVVYGYHSAAVTIGRKVDAKISDADIDGIEFHLDDLKQKNSFSIEYISRLFKDYKKAKAADRIELESIDKEHRNNHISSFVENAAKNGVQLGMLPYIIIAGRVMDEFDADVSGKMMTISSDIPISRGFASSAACSTAFAVALTNSLGVSTDDEKLIDIARDGDRVIHKNYSAGKIDVNASFYGGCILYNDKDGVVKEDVPPNLRLLIVDTGMKKPTSETVGIVAKHYKDDPVGTTLIFEEIDRCTIDGVSALKKGDLSTVGKLMYRNQEYLKKLDVSSPGLDTTVSESRKMGAYGAKLSGGGGGGIAIVLAKDPKQLSEKFSSDGLKTYLLSVLKEGTRDYVKRAKSISI
ncbi:MAG: mevalonate kinase [Candidatus Micrarchaeia archaeon]